MGHLITRFWFRAQPRLATAHCWSLDAAQSSSPSQMSAVAGPITGLTADWRAPHSWGLQTGLSVQLVTGLRPCRQLPSQPDTIQSLPETLQQNPQLTVAKHCTQGHKVIIRAHQRSVKVSWIVFDLSWGPWTPCLQSTFLSNLNRFWQFWPISGCFMHNEIPFQAFRIRT